jgi:hypothetical protein
MQHEFVHALLRLSVIRASRMKSTNAYCLGDAFSEMMEHINTFIHFDVTDEISVLVKSRAVKAVRSLALQHRAGSLARWRLHDAAVAAGASLQLPDS